MTYQKLFYLKYKKGFSTTELAHKFPEEINRVTAIALIEVPEETLRKVVTEETSYKKIIRLKKKFSRFL